MMSSSNINVFVVFYDMHLASTLIVFICSCFCCEFHIQLSQSDRLE